MQDRLARISADPNLVFNLSQFDEFMEIFEFYKSLSSELNNNAHYDIQTISRPYYFVPIDQKDIEVEVKAKQDEEKEIKLSSNECLFTVLSMLLVSK